MAKDPFSTANFRKTRFELRQLVQGPNGWAVTCSERGVSGSNIPELVIPEDLCTQAEIKEIVEAFTVIERCFERVFDEQEKSPAAVHALVTSAVQAKKDVEKAELDKVRLEEEVNARRAEIEAMDRTLDAKRKEHEALSTKA